MSVSKVVSALMLLVSRAGSTRRLSSPRARAARPGPSSPKRFAASRASSEASWPSRVNPAASSRRASAGPTPGRIVTGCGASQAAASAAPTTAKPRGLSRSAASLPSSRLGARPIETVTPTCVSTARAKRASTAAGGARCSASVPVRSSTASSIDSGCTSGVSASISSRIRRAAATYFAISGLMTTASGQSRSALNIGIALRTPVVRAM